MKTERLSVFTIDGAVGPPFHYRRRYEPATDGIYLLRFELFKTTAEEDAGFPKKLLVTPATKRQCSRPDVFAMDVGEFFVSPELRTLIETLEPGLHHFQPIDVELGGKSLGQYFLLRVSVRFTPLEESSEIDRALKLSDVAGHHLWTWNTRYHCSGEFRDRVTAADLGKGWKFKRATVVS